MVNKLPHERSKYKLPLEQPPGALDTTIKINGQISALALTYPEHLGSACGAYPLSCRPTILHGYALSVLHFLLAATLHTVCLHCVHLLFLSINNKLFFPQCQYVV